MEFKTIYFPDGKNRAYLDDYPSDCPSCHKKTTPNYKFHSFRDNLNFISVFFVCPNQDCEIGYVAEYVNMNVGTHYNFLKINNINPQTENFNEEITNVSPNFVKIYNESYFAEQNQLFEICGVGYRKALEFLIKDYLIHKNPEKEEDIKGVLLGKCIKDYVEDNRIKETSKRAVWLGNDHTHYIKKWEGKDLTDLKLLIKLSVNWIESELLTEQYVKNMSE